METIRRLLEQVEKVKPSRVVLDPLSEVRLLKCGSRCGYRRRFGADLILAGRNDCCVAAG